MTRSSQLRSDVSSLPRSGIRELLHKLEHRSDVIPLHRGEPMGNAPDHVLEAAARKAREGARYGPGAGVDVLRETIASKLEQVNGFERVNPDSVIVTHGAVQGCAAVFDAILEPGDGVLIPDVAYPNYALLASLRGAQVEFYRVDPANGFSPDLDDVVRRLGAHTRIVVVNSPANPTGWVGDEATMHAMVELAQRHDCLIVSDEAYDELVYDGPRMSPAAYDADHVVSMFSFSKTYSMTGWRVGYVHAPLWLAHALKRIQEGTLGGVSVVTQAGALAALVGPQDSVRDKLATYRSRRDLVEARLEAANLEPLATRGGLFAFIATGDAPSDAALEELVVRGVAMVPGTVFGPGGEGFLRASLGVDDDELDKGIGIYVEWRQEADHGGA